MTTMCKFWNKNNYQSSAKVVDGNLILTLPDAINPVIWRMELGNVRSSAMEIRANDNHFLLALKTPKGDVHDIAPFDSRERALHALMQVSNALGKAEGKMTMASTPSASIIAPTAASSKGSGIKWLLVLGGVVLLIFLVAYLSSMTSRPSEFNASSTTDGGTSSASEGESGVPLSADQYLRGF